MHNQELDMSQHPVAQLWRYDVSVADGTYTEHCLTERSFEFPSVHPVYAGQLLQLSCTSFALATGYFSLLQDSNFAARLIQ